MQLVHRHIIGAAPGGRLHGPPEITARKWIGGLATMKAAAVFSAAGFPVLRAAGV